jgi:hypothetical protein
MGWRLLPGGPAVEVADLRRGEHGLPHVTAMMHPHRASFLRDELSLIGGRVTPSPVFMLECMKMRCDHRYEPATERVVDEDWNQALTARERAIIGFASASHLGAAPPGPAGRAGRAAAAVSGARQRGGLSTSVAVVRLRAGVLGTRGPWGGSLGRTRRRRSDAGGARGWFRARWRGTKA